MFFLVFYLKRVIETAAELLFKEIANTTIHTLHIIYYNNKYVYIRTSYHISQLLV